MGFAGVSRVLSLREGKISNKADLLCISGQNLSTRISRHVATISKQNQVISLKLSVLKSIFFYYNLRIIFQLQSVQFLWATYDNAVAAK